MSRDTNGGNPSGFSMVEPEVQYRPISGMAVVCMVLALLSILAFASRLFWIFPLVTVVLSGITAWNLERAKQEYAGQLLAQGALLLGLICGLSSVTRWHLEWIVYGREARIFCDQYMDAILTNQFDEVFNLRLPPPARFSGETLDALKTRYVQRQRDMVDAPEVLVFSGKLADAQVYSSGPVYDLIFTEGYYAIACDYEIELENRAYTIRVITRGARASKGEWEGRAWYIYNADVRLKPTPE